MPLKGITGECFFAITDDNLINNHLFVVLSSSCEQNDEVIVAFITTLKPVKATAFSQDQTTILVPGNGQHPFITRNSIVCYAKADIKTVAELKSAENSGKIRQDYNSFPNVDQRRMVDGLLSSPSTPPQIKKFVSNNECQ